MLLRAFLSVPRLDALHLEAGFPPVPMPSFPWLCLPIPYPPFTHFSHQLSVTPERTYPLGPSPSLRSARRSTHTPLPPLSPPLRGYATSVQNAHIQTACPHAFLHQTPAHDLLGRIGRVACERTCYNRSTQSRHTQAGGT